MMALIRYLSISFFIMTSADEEEKFVVPQEIRGRNVRACLVCGLIKTQAQFLDSGCENCSFLDLKGSKEKIAE